MKFAWGLLAATLTALPAGAQPPPWSFKEELRLGSDQDDATGFSDIRGLLVDRRGNLWVLEASTQEIRVFDPAGKHLRNIGRKGKGPGEFTYADGMAVAPDGLIWVHDPQNARFSIFDQDGKFVRQQLAVSNGYGYLWTGGIDPLGRIWDRIFLPTERGVLAFRRANPGWTTVDTLRPAPCKGDGKPEDTYFQFPRGTMGVPFYPGPVSAFDYTRGLHWCGPTGAEYRLAAVGMERGDTLARVNGRTERLPVSDAEREQEIAEIKKFIEKVGGTADYARIPKVKPLLLGLQVDGEGRLWVRRSAGPGTAAFDLYSAQGQPIARFNIAHPVSPWHRPVVRGNQVWLVTQEDGEIPYIVRGRLGP